MELRIGQLVDEAAVPPEGSPEQERIDTLISELQDGLVAHSDRTPQRHAEGLLRA
jgi:hypothetical protein